MTGPEPIPALPIKDGIFRRLRPRTWKEATQSWGVWVLSLLMTVLFWWRGELGWSFLSLWSLIVTTAPAIREHALDSVIPAGLMMIAAIPFLAHSLGLVTGVAQISEGTFAHATFALGCYSVAFMTYISLAMTTSLRLNWALLNTAVVFLSIGLCSFTMVLSFLSDQYLMTDRLAGDNTIVMVELTWTLIGSLMVGWLVTKVIGPSAAIYQPYTRELPEGGR